MEQQGPGAGGLKGSWRAALKALKRHDERRIAGSGGEREILYLLDIDRTVAAQALTLELRQRERRATGQWGKLKPLRIVLGQAQDLPDPADRRILSLLAGGRVAHPLGSIYPAHERLPDTYRLSLPLADMVLPLLGATGRLRLVRSSQGEEGPPLAWDGGEPWRLVLEIESEAGGAHALGAVLERGEERMGLEEPELLVAGGFVFARGACARLDDARAFGWISILRVERRLTIPAGEIGPFLEQLFLLPRRPAIHLPEELRWEEVRVEPQARLAFRSRSRSAGASRSLAAELSFDYAGHILSGSDPTGDLPDAEGRRRILRDAAAEAAAAGRLRKLGLEPASGRAGLFSLSRAALPAIVRALVPEGWHVLAEDGQVFRAPSRLGLSVTTGIDWFELRGTASYGDEEVDLPELLAALAREDGMLVLGDGSFGVLPEEWLARHAPLAALGRRSGNHLRFRRSQVALLDALLAEQPESSWDEAARRARAELASFEGVEPVGEPAGFRGTLRDYQREGVGWFGFLERFGFGGCLADDMGLGKTVQVLALLQARRALPRNGPAKPSLVVAPRSLVYNWQEEAARFTPGLRFVDHTGSGRHAQLADLGGQDVLITTYGTLRRDAALLARIEFDYAVLDEAQAIKNSETQVAKAARLLTADHRLALSGTPIENHLGELWSLFEFLNPGMLGRAAAFRRLEDDPAGSLGSRAGLARALRPFILRRTKGQVARELPEKVEQTIHCEMEPRQRRLYVELQEHYRSNLGRRIEEHGMQRSAFQVLEALLRLRQAACHPGLIDPRRRGEPSAKLDALLPQLAEVTAEGHKALVFSQFTSLLSIVRDRLDAERVPYAYLDGRTRDRGARVQRFQTDPACKLFLISLKAGGLGLNLTAAEYVFLLDPWWNPAVEAQAVDRAHRIGQTNRVFAYRLVTRDTVEEKILALQREKRELADAILLADDAPLASLTREELWSLLS